MKELMARGTRRALFVQNTPPAQLLETHYVAFSYLFFFSKQKEASSGSKR
jgi:hypothetical protein